MASGFSDDEVREILQRAIERDASRGGSTGTQELLEIAAELGVSADDVSAAMAEVAEARELQREMAAVREQRRRSLGGSIVTWLLVCSLLLFIDWMTGPEWWVVWPFAIWGFFIALLARRAYFPSRQSLESKASARLVKRRKRDERELRRQRHRGLEQGLERALERGVTALVEAAARHVDRVTADSSPHRGQGQQRVEPIHEAAASPVTANGSDEERAAARRQRR